MMTRKEKQSLRVLKPGWKGFLLGVLMAFLMIGGAFSEVVPPKIKIGYLPLNNHTAYYAYDLGFFKEEGLNVEVNQFDSGPAMVEAMMAGELHVGDIATMPMWHMAIRGLPFYFLASDGYLSPEYPAGAIVVNSDSPIKSFKDLKEKKIAQPAPGTLSYVSIIFAAAKIYGMKSTDFTQIYIPFPQMGGVLVSRQVDAVYSWPPFDTLLELKHGARVLVNDTEWLNYCQASGLVVKRDFADRYPETTKKIVKAWIKAGRWANDHSKEARMIAMKYLKLPEEVAMKMRMLYWPRNGYQLMPSVWEIYYIMSDTEQIKPHKDPESLVNDYWMKPALKFITPVLRELGEESDPYTEKILKKPLFYTKGDAKYLGPWIKGK